MKTPYRKHPTPMAGIRAATAAGFLLVAGPLGAQALVRIERAALTLPSRLNIGVRLQVEPAGPAKQLGRGPGYIEVELPVRATANVPWSLSITGTEGKEDGELLAIQDADGAWVTPKAGEAVKVVKRRQPESPIAVAIRMRLAASAGPEAARQVRLVVAAAEGEARGER
ncbi:MAG: hypothetical protein ACKVS7_17260 [Gemmatimonadaceae bacterium]